MNIYIDRSSGQAVVTRDKQMLRFNMGLYREGRTTKALSEAKDYFMVLDHFIQTMPIQDQNALWSFYVNCRQALDDTLDTSDIVSILQSEIATISSIIHMDRLKSWYSIHSGIPIPPELKESLSDLPDTTLATPDQTYLRKDYIGLCALSMAMTMLSPIFSAYVEKTKSEHGTGWKTYYAYFLISKSTYYRCDDMERLQRYITVTLESMPIRYDSIILSGISKDEYPLWMTATVVTKKVATGDITGDPMVPPLIKFIYKYIQQKVQSMEKDFHGKVKHRLAHSSGSSEDAAISMLEAYNSRQEITDNYTVICEYYLSDIYTAAWKLDPTIPKSLITESISTKDRLYHLLYSSEISDGQINILKWVINEILPARMIDYLSRDAVINAIIIARAYLWHKQYYDLAALVSGVPISNEEEHMVTGTDRRSRSNKDFLERVDEYFPYYRKSTGSKKFKIVKSVQISADHVESQLNKNDWHLTLPDEWLNSQLLGSSSRHYAIPDDIRLSLIGLALDLAAKPKVPAL